MIALCRESGITFRCLVCELYISFLRNISLVPFRDRQVIDIITAITNTNLTPSAYNLSLNRAVLSEATDRGSSHLGTFFSILRPKVQVQRVGIPPNKSFCMSIIQFNDQVGQSSDWPESEPVVTVWFLLMISYPL